MNRPVKMDISILCSLQGQGGRAAEARPSPPLRFPRTVCLLLPLLWTDLADETDARGWGAPDEACIG